MNITFEDLNRIAEEQSRRDVEIARLKMEMEAARIAHAREYEKLMAERDALWREHEELQRQNEMLVTDYENIRFQNHWMKQFILLSVERVRDVFSRIRDIRLLSAIKSFVLEMLPVDASPEQIAFASEVMSLPTPKDEASRVVNVSGNYNDVHDNGRVGLTDVNGMGGDGYGRE